MIIRPDVKIDVQTSDQSIIETGSRVLKTEGEALLAFSRNLDAAFIAAAKAIFATKGRIITSGMGKSGHIARKVAATLASTGTPAYFVHPAEASHGDLGMITADDLCLVFSNSGETSELSDIIAHTRRFGIILIGVASRPQSTLLTSADIALVLPDQPEACAIGMAPTTSTTMSLALGDALCVAVMEMRGFAKENFQTFHPGGKLGAQLMRVSQLMHGFDQLPLIKPDAPMSDALLVMTAKSFGVVGIVDAQGYLAGIITDGDLRRNMDKLMAKTAAQVMNAHPRSIAPDALAAEALRIMNEKAITCLFVLDEATRPVGLIHLHDTLRAGIR